MHLDVVRGRKDCHGELGLANHGRYLAPEEQILGAASGNADDRFMESAIEGPCGPILQLLEQLLNKLKSVFMSVVPNLRDLVLAERAADDLSVFDQAHTEGEPVFLIGIRGGPHISLTALLSNC